MFDGLVKLGLVELPVFVQVEGIDCLDDVSHAGILVDQLQLGFGQIPLFVLVYQLQKEDGAFYIGGKKLNLASPTSKYRSDFVLV